jgi:hypothetical protein
MSLLRRRRHLVMLSSSVVPGDRFGSSASIRTKRKGRMRRLVRVGGLLTVIGLMGAFRVARSRRRLLAGLVIPALAVILRDSVWGLLFFAAFLLYLPPWSPERA